MLEIEGEVMKDLPKGEPKVRQSPSCLETAPSGKKEGGNLSA